MSQQKQISKNINRKENDTREIKNKTLFVITSIIQILQRLVCIKQMSQLASRSDFRQAIRLSVNQAWS